MARVLVAVASVAIWASAAQAEVLISADGVVYDEAVNGDGTVLRGRGETIYLGRGCDALIRGVGHGDWAWSARGTIVRIGRYTVYFPGQVPDYSPGRCLL